MLEPDCVGVVVGTYVNDGFTQSGSSAPKESIEFQRDHGVVGDKHAGPETTMKPARHPVLKYLVPVGTPIANIRQFSVVSLEELREIAQRMSLDEVFPYGCLGENLVLEGIPDFTQLPPATQLAFYHDGVLQVVLLVIMANPACITPGEEIRAHYPDVDFAQNFVRAAQCLRGLVGIVLAVENSGEVSPGDTVKVYLPR